MQDKYHAPANTPLGEFVDFIQLQSGLSIKKPIFVFFKNTITQTGELLLN
ncbi:PREDICTED: tRNA (guanine(9)-N1)-methyltransferase isoform X2 [Prunus dulcis]|uniref:PREDICTED: tRNA (Guanine(9)-N1)-methyltransferase isoform X2 n=1 Tax=Prunus dulcis TaxID=3755 RepID=A0A5E4FUR9_PRUDU|nr:PREDICTED: tRNA (guanine(9)-N1)-methyltransferase isoform X2 [Prunus dulcis]